MNIDQMIQEHSDLKISVSIRDSEISRLRAELEYQNKQVTMLGSQLNQQNIKVAELQKTASVEKSISDLTKRMDELFEKTNWRSNI